MIRRVRRFGGDWKPPDTPPLKNRSCSAEDLPDRVHARSSEARASDAKTRAIRIRSSRSPKQPGLSTAQTQARARNRLGANTAAAQPRRRPQLYPTKPAPRPLSSAESKRAFSLAAVRWPAFDDRDRPDLPP